MNISVPLLIAMPLFLLAYFVYARYLARVMGLDPQRETPAVSQCDNVDFVPTKGGVVFSHHFASIAGGGPILGPTIALIYGYNMSLLWIIVGCIFFGAVHDFTALFVSVRERGRSMAEVARQSLGDAGFLLFIAFTIIMLFMVIVAFLGATVAALTSKYPLALMGMAQNQTLLRTVVEDGVAKGCIGGIASTSVMVITLCSPLLGYLLYIKKIPVWIASLLALGVCAVSIEIGVQHPVTLDPNLWRTVLCVYVLLAAGIPVWLILQPRDFTNSFILYIGIGVMVVAIIYGGLAHAGGAATAAFTIGAPAFNLAEGAKKLGLVWPILFITVACGAISGFHALVAGGTSSKQLCNESHTMSIGYGGMLLEGLMAVAVLSVVAAGIEFSQYRDIVFPEVKGVPGNPILAFALGIGSVVYKSLGIPQVYGTVFGILLVEGFVVTTLDTAVRLNRYLFEEMWAIVFKDKTPKLLKSYLVNAGIVVVVCWLLARGNTITKIWPIFGAANQLLAALVLIVAAVWLSQRKKPTWFVTVPAAFMLVTTIASLFYLLQNTYIKTKNWPLVVSDLLLIALAAGVILMLIQRFFLKKSNTPTLSGVSPDE